MKKNNRKGFTIVELVIVIAVIAILAAVLIPTFSGMISKSKSSAAMQEAKNLQTEYLASIDYGKGEKVEKNYHIKVDDYWFEVKEGALNTEPLTLAEDATAPTGATKYITADGDDTGTDFDKACANDDCNATDACDWCGKAQAVAGEG